MADDDGSLMYKTQPYAFQAKGGEKLTWPGISETLNASARLVRQKRPFRKGAKLDRTGSEPRMWTVLAIFNNTISEHGISGGLALFPDRMNKIIALVEEFDTLDFFHPIDGQIRASVESAVRVMPEDETDTGRVTFTIIEDNEENIDARQIQTAIRGSAILLSEQTSFSATLEDDWTGGIEEIKEFGAELEGLMRAPGRTADDIDTQARAVVRACDSVLATQEETRRDGQRRALTGPGDSTARALERMKDRVYGARAESNKHRPKSKPWRVSEQTTIFRIAAQVGQPVKALIDLNGSKIEDPFRIQPGYVEVYERWP